MDKKGHDLCGDLEHNDNAESRKNEYTNGNHSQEDQLEGPSLDGMMMSGMI